MLQGAGVFGRMAHAPTKVITVEREYGSRGGEFAHELAARLGWRLLDSELVEGAARIAGVDPKMAAKFDERLDPWYYRYGKLFWQDSSYSTIGKFDDHVLDSERLLGLIRQEILDAAQEGQCVLVGRGAACALAGQPGSFHIFVYATTSAKKDWFARAFPKEADHAEEHLAAFDKRRAAVIRKFYQQEWCSRGLYHMLLNSCMGVEAMIAAVQCAAGLCVAPAQATAVGATTRSGSCD
ncbi:MAG TPA: cytidylate kinase-like family protein [Terracidiphilus sp.]|nr:cytidylate kinase-like family protein [Terracidiphilus sp.]